MFVVPPTVLRFACCVFVLALGACTVGDTLPNCVAGTSCKKGEKCSHTVCNPLLAAANGGAGGAASSSHAGRGAQRDASTPPNALLDAGGGGRASDDDAGTMTTAPMSRDDDAGIDKPAKPIDASVPAAGSGGTPPSAAAGSRAPTCQPTPEACNGVDDDCNGTVDDVADLLTSTANCGRCGNACATGQTCEAGSCRVPSPQTLQCGSVECVNTAERGCCDGQCVDLTTNTNCGSCGTVCGLVGAGITCNCELRDDAYGCYGLLGGVLALCAL